MNRESNTQIALSYGRSLIRHIPFNVFPSLLPWLLRPACIPSDYNNLTVDNAGNCIVRCHYKGNETKNKANQKNLIYSNRLQCTRLLFHLALYLNILQTFTIIIIIIAVVIKEVHSH